MPVSPSRELVWAALDALELSSRLSSRQAVVRRHAAAHLARIQDEGERVVEALVATRAIHEHASRSVFSTLAELAAIAEENASAGRDTQPIAGLAGEYVTGVRAVCRAASDTIHQSLRTNHKE